MKRRPIKLFALLLLALFFLPYILKVQEWDLILLLVAGLALPAGDFLTSGQDD
ncbi:MAG: hypothetical protein KIS62_03500 [Ramlibacter sp.]|nr:hypothetical protein [Ramlibacter sp.]MCW5648791.1 hypothetical protein [Ramlibacter sp.]